MPRRTALVAAAVLLGSGWSVLLQPSAEAHVHVDSDTATAGADADLIFTVPNESAKAKTVEVSVQLPQDHPFLEVSARVLPGWKVATIEARLPKPVVTEGTTLTRAIRTVTWTVEDASAAIPPGQYQEFALAVGPLPPAGVLRLPAVQTYSDGSVVRWNQATPASGPEPENPAPELTVTETSAKDPTGGAAAGGAGGARGTDVTARVVAGAALGVGAAAVVVAALAMRRSRRRADTGGLG